MKRLLQLLGPIVVFAIIIFGASSAAYAETSSQAATATATVLACESDSDVTPVAFDGQGFTPPEGKQLRAYVEFEDGSFLPPLGSGATVNEDGSVRLVLPDLPVGTYTNSRLVAIGFGEPIKAKLPLYEVKTCEQVNHPPVASDVSAKTSQDVAVSGTFNASDPDAGDALTYSAPPASTSGGKVSTNGSAWRYTPKPGYSGTDTFGYMVTDSHGASASATVTIMVKATVPTNHPPVVKSATVQVAFNTATSFAVAATDQDGDELTWNITKPTHGTLTGDGGKYIYTPIAGYSGTDTVKVTVTDPEGLSDTATVTFKVAKLTPPCVKVSDIVKKPWAYFKGSVFSHNNGDGTFTVKYTYTKGAAAICGKPLVVVYGNSSVAAATYTGSGGHTPNDNPQRPIAAAKSGALTAPSTVTMTVAVPESMWNWDGGCEAWVQSDVTLIIQGHRLNVASSHPAFLKVTRAGCSTTPKPTTEPTGTHKVPTTVQTDGAVPQGNGWLYFGIAAFAAGLAAFFARKAIERR